MKKGLFITKFKTLVWIIVALVIISKEGSGKGRYIELIRRMLGKLLLETNDIRDISGRFNSLLQCNLLVNLNETSNFEDGYRATFDKMKSLITDIHQRIEKKGIDPITVENYSRFIFTTNNLRPVSVSNNDRRYCVSIASDKKIGNKEYFKKLTKALDDSDHFYTYLKRYKITELEIPDTKIREELKCRSIPVHVDILTDLYCSGDEYIVTQDFLMKCNEDYNKNYTSPRKLGNDFRKYFPNNKKDRQKKIKDKNYNVYTIDKDYIKNKVLEIHGIDIDKMIE